MNTSSLSFSRGLSSIVFRGGGVAAHGFQVFQIRGVPPVPRPPARRRPQAGESINRPGRRFAPASRHQHARQQAHCAFAGRGASAARHRARSRRSAARRSAGSRSRAGHYGQARGGSPPPPCTTPRSSQTGRRARCGCASPARRGRSVRRSRAAEAQHLAADEAGIALQAHLGGEPGERAFMDDALLRQPLAHRARRHRDVLREHAARAGTAIPLAGTRVVSSTCAPAPMRRSTRSSSPPTMPAGGCTNRVVADGLAFRVERARTRSGRSAHLCEHAACAALLVFQAQPGAPGRGYRGAGANSEEAREAAAGHGEV